MGASLGVRLRRRAVLGAMSLFVELLLGGTGLHVPPVVAAIVLAFVAWQAAYRGVQVSAILMLVLEAISVSIIARARRFRAARARISLDADQCASKGRSPASLGLSIATAVFSCVGFESATAFGAEAKRPLVTIPRAVIRQRALATAFFVITTYAEIVGLQHAAIPLDKLDFPLGALAQIYVSAICGCRLLSARFRARFPCASPA